MLCAVVTEDEINKALEEGDDVSSPAECEPHILFPHTAPTTTTNHNTNSNSTASPHTLTNNCNSSVDQSSDDAEYKEEEEDSGVEASAGHPRPEPSERGPTFGISGAELHRNRLQTQQDSVKLSWEETK